MDRINLLALINESVDNALVTAQMENTTENRISILNGMHRRISNQGTITKDDRSILQAVEDEIVRLQDESL